MSLAGTTTTALGTGPSGVFSIDLSESETTRPSAVFSAVPTRCQVGQRKSRAKVPSGFMCSGKVISDLIPWASRLRVWLISVRAPAGRSRIRKDGQEDRVPSGSSASRPMPLEASFTAASSIDQVSNHA